MAGVGCPTCRKPCRISDADRARFSELFVQVDRQFVDRSEFENWGVMLHHLCTILNELHPIDTDDRHTRDLFDFLSRFANIPVETRRRAFLPVLDLLRLLQQQGEQQQRSSGNSSNSSSSNSSGRGGEGGESGGSSTSSSSSSSSSGSSSNNNSSSGEQINVETDTHESLPGHLRSATLRIVNLNELEEACDRNQRCGRLWECMQASEQLKIGLEAAVGALPPSISAAHLAHLGWDGSRRRFTNVPRLGRVVQALEEGGRAATDMQRPTCGDAGTQVEPGELPEPEAEQRPWNRMADLLPAVLSARAAAEGGGSADAVSGDSRGSWKQRQQMALLLYTVREALDFPIASKLGRPWRRDEERQPAPGFGRGHFRLFHHLRHAERRDPRMWREWVMHVLTTFEVLFIELETHLGRHLRVHRQTLLRVATVLPSRPRDVRSGEPPPDDGDALPPEAVEAISRAAVVLMASALERALEQA
eukprot:CAMPEP_0204140330 /NCGR_PEP_ID=MMETSP0361-20130328/18918_1 /ASSEMBLY_ACC=CAM_ASM_000343 /TAXON_ID=268821 /ORGANISM="Scrippsiella Hangoei, Strain SHTV-5" /LENGTH=475 /DNA_ID=CAMNT_0051094139 /DNA_START=87 /DNA_END=1514 /DNA_ORIENTATION=-